MNKKNASSNIILALIKSLGSKLEGAPACQNAYTHKLKTNFYFYLFIGFLSRLSRPKVYAGWVTNLKTIKPISIYYKSRMANFQSQLCRESHILGGQKVLLKPDLQKRYGCCC